MSKSSRARSILICLVLALGTFLVYVPVAHFDFVNFDDPDYVTQNFNINRGLSWKAIVWSFNAGYAGNWHPLTWLSLALDCQLFGPNPGPLHLVNLALHILNSILLFLALASLTGKTWPSAFVAALFAWHPLHVESVAWIAERKDVLSAFFFILTLWAYGIYARESKSHRRKALIYYVVSLILAALGLMAKPMLVTIPFVLLLLDAWPLQRLPLQIRNWTPLVLEKIPFFILAVASSVLTLYAQGREDAIRPLAQIPLVTRLLNALVAYTQYLNNLFWPRHLSAFHSYDFSVSVANGAWAAVLIGLICLAGLYFWKRQPYWLVGCLWFLGMLVPVIGIVQVGGQAFADRYAYLPSIGVFIVVCWTVADSVGLTASVARRSAGALFGTAVLVACLCLTRAQVMTWRDGGSAAQHAIDIELNNILARSALASYLLNNHEWDAARSQCEAALKIFPDHALTHDYLGTILYFQGHYPEAEQHLLWALRIDPALPDANFRLGDLYLAIGKPEAAQQKFKAYLSYNPEDPRANCGLGKALAMQGRHADAVWEFIAALKVGYNYPEAHRLLALSLSTLRRPSDAALEYQRALQFDPSDLDSLNNLAWLQSTSPDPTLRNGTNAIVLANRACELTTNLQPVFIGTLAAAYAEAGRFDDAIAAAQKARDLALAQTNQPIADANLKLLDLYRLHQPYREK